MFPLDVLGEPVWQRLTWTLLHFLWQALAVTTDTHIVPEAFETPPISTDAESTRCVYDHFLYVRTTKRTARRRATRRLGGLRISVLPLIAIRTRRADSTP